MSRGRYKTIILNLRWHRRIGLSTAVLVILLAATGLLLNHSPTLNLGDTHLNNKWLLDWYGFETGSLDGFPVRDRWLSHPGGSELFLDTRPVARCQPPLLSATGYGEHLLALCSDSLIILTSAGELVESLGRLQGLPPEADAVQTAGDRILLRTGGQTLSLDFETLDTATAASPQNAWPAARPLPKQLWSQLRNQGELPGISLETLLLDLHSGRFFGTAGTLFVDFVGLLLCILALTGLWAWYNHYRLKKSSQ